MRSHIVADYSAWTFLVLQPVDPTIIEEINQERGIPEQMIIDGLFWPTPTSTTVMLPTASASLISTPPETGAIPASSPTAFQAAEWPTPTSIMLVPELTLTQQPTKPSIISTAGPSFPTVTATRVSIRTVTPIATKTLIHYPASPTSTPIPGTASMTSASTAIPTSTSTYTATSTSTPTSLSTYTGTSTTIPTFTSSATPIFISTMTAVVTSTDTPTLTATPTTTPTPTSTSILDSSEPGFQGPDGNVVILGNGMSVEFNLSGFLLNGNSTWDVVYYEKQESSSSNKIHLGAVWIEVYDETTTAWYTVYYWGDGIVDTNVSYNYDNDEPDGFPVDKTDLYGVPPFNTGIAIDIDAAGIAQGGAIGDSITKIRITSLSKADCEVDALRMLR